MRRQPTVIVGSYSFKQLPQSRPYQCPQRVANGNLGAAREADRGRYPVRFRAGPSLTAGGSYRRTSAVRARIALNSEPSFQSGQSLGSLAIALPIT